MPTKKPPILREGRHWDVDPETGCWIWKLYTLKGYARTQNGQASRVLWKQLGREIPDGHHLHHKCPNTACVNPDHLEPRPHGAHVASHHRRLSLEEARRIRELGQTHTMTELSEMTGLQVPAIWKLLNGYNYAALGGEPIVRRVSCDECGAPAEGRRRFCTAKCRRRFHGRKQGARRKAERKATNTC